MIPISFPSIESLFVLAILYCLLISVLIKGASFFARSFGVDGIVSVKLLRLWALNVVALIASFALTLALGLEDVFRLFFLLGVSVVCWMMLYDKSYRVQNIKMTAAYSLVFSLFSVGLPAALLWLWLEYGRK